MKHPEGHYADVADIAEPEREMTCVRVNVDTFDEAHAIFMVHGFTNPPGEGTADPNSSRAATLISPSGFRRAPVQHIKDHD